MFIIYPMGGEGIQFNILKNSKISKCSSCCPWVPQGWIRGSIEIEVRYEIYQQHVHYLPYVWCGYIVYYWNNSKISICSSCCPWVPQGWIRSSIGIELRYEDYHQHVHHLPYGWWCIQLIKKILKISKCLSWCPWVAQELFSL